MSITTPVPITAMDGITPPSTDAPASFDSRGDATLGALPALQTQSNALATVNYNNALSAQSDALLAQTAAGNAAASAATAVAASGAPVWVSGTSYALNVAVYSPITGMTYRRRIAGAGTIDPSADGTNWLGIDTSLRIIEVTGTTHTATAGTHCILKNVAATTVTLPPTPVTGDQVWVTVDNGMTTNLINFNGKPHMDRTWASDPTMTLDNRFETVKLRFTSAKWIKTS